MADNSKIEWTDATWNPMLVRREDGKVGYHCEKISPACANCYACAFNRRTLPARGTGLDYTRANRDKVDFFVDDETLRKPFSWQASRKVFVCSMTDLFGEWHTDEMIDRVFAVMALRRRHVFQVLTKRPERMAAYIERAGKRIDHLEAVARELGWTLKFQGMGLVPWPLANVWCGVTVEDRARLKRVDELRGIPAAVRFLSIEPLLENLGEIDLTGIHWVIVGGESGHGARPMHPDWVRSLLDQCQSASVPFFFKQWGAWADGTVKGRKSKCLYDDGRLVEMTQQALLDEERRSGEEHNRFAPTAMTCVGKKAAGRLLDGREWSEFPKAVTA